MSKNSVPIGTYWHNSLRVLMSLLNPQRITQLNFRHHYSLLYLNILLAFCISSCISLFSFQIYYHFSVTCFAFSLFVSILIPLVFKFSITSFFFSCHSFEFITSNPIDAVPTFFPFPNIWTASPASGFSCTNSSSFNCFLLYECVIKSNSSKNFFLFLLLLEISYIYYLYL